jgi:hypothetical protein
MPVGLPVALVMLAQIYGPAAPPATKPPQAAPSAEKDCSPSAPDPKTGEIVVCAIKPEGYRLNPDVLEAKREIHNGGRLKPPENFKRNDCATIGPMGCRGQYFDLMAAAATLAKVADRLSTGQEVGSLFATDPHPSEYQLYLEAKQRREAKEAEAKAKAAWAAAKKASSETKPESSSEH